MNPPRPTMQNFNTSHVNVNPMQNLTRALENPFQYI